MYCLLHQASLWQQIVQQECQLWHNPNLPTSHMLANSTDKEEINVVAWLHANASGPPSPSLSLHHCLGTQYSHQKLTIMFALTERAYWAVFLMICCWKSTPCLYISKQRQSNQHWTSCVGNYCDYRHLPGLQCCCYQTTGKSIAMMVGQERALSDSESKNILDTPIFWAQIWHQWSKDVKKEDLFDLLI